MSEPHPDLVEAVARDVYEQMPYDEPTGTKPAWVPGGNSHKQNEARAYAKAAIKAHTEWLQSQPLTEVAKQIWPHVGPVTQAGRVQTAMELVRGVQNAPIAAQQKDKAE